MKKLALIIVFTLLITAFCAISVSAAVDPTVLDSIAAGKNVLTANVVLDSVVGPDGFSDAEAAPGLFDGDTATKFCTPNLPASVTWKMDAAYTVDSYLLATANDNAQYTGRNPATWTLSGSTDNTNWTVIDTGTEADMADVDFTYFMFTVDKPASYQYYKFDIDSTTSGTLQVSELVLCGAAAAAETTAAAADTAAPAAAAPVETTAAPQTADAFAVIVCALAVAGTGIIISKKR
jgi:hypothetical protein